MEKEAEFDYEFDFEFIRGQHHYQKGKSKEELASRYARCGYESEKFQHEKKIKKAEQN